MSLIVVTAGQEPLVEEDELSLNVQWTQAQSLYLHHVAYDEAHQDPWWMG